MYENNDMYFVIHTPALLNIRHINILSSVIKILELIHAKGNLVVTLGYIEDLHFNEGRREEVLLFLTTFTKSNIIDRKYPVQIREANLVHTFIRKEAVKVQIKSKASTFNLLTAIVLNEKLPIKKVISQKEKADALAAKIAHAEKIAKELIAADAEREKERKLRIRNEFNDQIRTLIDYIAPSNEYLKRADSLSTLKKMTIQRYHDIDFSAFKLLYENMSLCLNDDGSFCFIVEQLSIICCVTTVC
jgi:hypothetical protein